MRDFPWASSTGSSRKPAALPVWHRASLSHGLPQHRRFPTRRVKSGQRSGQRKQKSGRFTLIEADFDPDGDKTDLMWFGFHIRDEKGLAVPYDRAREFGLNIFNVAGVTYRPDMLQRDCFKPGTTVKLLAEPDNKHDPNAVSVWDQYGSWMVGYVPREQNRRVRAAIEKADQQALVLAEQRKDGKRVSLTVMVGPLKVSSDVTT